MYVSTLEPESSASTNSATFAPERYRMAIVGPGRVGVKRNGGIGSDGLSRLKRWCFEFGMTRYRQFARRKTPPSMDCRALVSRDARRTMSSSRLIYVFRSWVPLFEMESMTCAVYIMTNSTTRCSMSG